MTAAAISYTVTVVASRLNWVLMPLTVMGGFLLSADLTRWWLEVRDSESGAIAARIGRVAVLDDAQGLADLVRRQSVELQPRDFVRYLHAIEHGSSGAQQTG